MGRLSLDDQRGARHRRMWSQRADRGGPGGRALLDNVGQLVREQSLALTRSGRKFIRAKHDVVSHCEGAGLESAGRRGGAAVGVDAYVAEIVADRNV